MPSAPDTEPPARSNDPLRGATIDNRYKVEAAIGEGGMGVVYRCRHTIIGKKVAMKVLRSDLARDQEVMERFLNEAKAASAIGNPHIIDISDFGQLPDSSTYFVMEYLDGISLADAIGEGRPLPVPRIVAIARQLAEGLFAAHAAGIIHRDLKPDNIYLVTRGTDRDFVKILDFGIAKVSNTGERLTRAGTVFGTPHYMSPEQAAGAPIDHRCDIYSLGVILYEMSSGKVPFDADNFMGILTQHMYKAPVPIRALIPEPQEVPPGLEAIVLKCLSKRPEQRYQTMEEVAFDLDRLEAGVIPEAVAEMMGRSAGFNVPADYFQRAAMPAPVPATPDPTTTGTNRWPLYAGLAGVLAAVGIVVFIFSRSQLSTAALPVEQQAVASASAVPATSAAPVLKEVLLAADPADTEVFDGQQSLGQSPVLVRVASGQTLQLTLMRNGYAPKVVPVDGSQPKLQVKLERERSVPMAPAAAPATPKPKPRARGGRIGGGEIVDPWD
jgi:serine/threonine-protein kinase